MTSPISTEYAPSLQTVSLFPPKSESRKKLYKVLITISLTSLALITFVGSSLTLGFCIHHLYFLSLLILPALILIIRNLLSQMIYEVYVALKVLPSLAKPKTPSLSELKP